MFEAMIFQCKLPDLIIPLTSADLFLGLSDKLARGFNLLSGRSAEDPGSETHPPALKRRDFLWTFFTRVSGQRSPLQNAAYFDCILDALWAPIENELMELRQRGKRLHASWRV
jgi:hypothetical protein